MPGGPIAEAFVEISPRFDRFPKELERGVQKAVSGASNVVKK